MNDEYLIIDIRNLEDLKKKTFSGYKKKDVFNVLNKSMETNKIENMCNWIGECICSLYIVELWNHLILFASKIVNINNPLLPNILYKNNILFYNIYNNIDSKNINNLYDLRNNQIIRNLLFSVSTIITMSSKSKRYDKYPKLKDIDF